MVYYGSEKKVLKKGVINMSASLALELFGYLGSVLVLVSMLMTSVVRLRIINLIGSAIFATYAILIRSYPTALLNGCLVIINLYHLYRLRHATDKAYELQPLGAGEGFTSWFIHQYQEDIRRFFPEVDPEQAKNSEGFAVFFDNQAAGVLLGKKNDSSFEILLDYTTPTFRDCSVGEYLYGQLPTYGITRLLCTENSPEHAEYMEKMGFTRQENRVYVKQV